MAKSSKLSPKSLAKWMKSWVWPALLFPLAVFILWFTFSRLFDSGEADVIPWHAVRGRDQLIVDIEPSQQGAMVVQEKQLLPQQPQLDIRGLTASMPGPGDADAFFGLNPEDETIEPFPPDNEMRVAICLTGEARDFQLTGPSILHHLLPAYPNTHVFMHAPLEERAFKFFLLAWAAQNVTIGGVRLFPLDSMDERKCLYGMVSNKWTPTCQAILQQFRLIQGCLSLVSAFEKGHRFRFNWILRTRADSFWSRAPPLVRSLDPKAHTFPYGSDCGGLNDRFAMGRWRTARIAMSRLALLPHIYANNHSLNGLNPETVLSSELSLFNVPIGRAHFWFCVMSRKFYSIYGMPIPDMGSGYRVPLNGAKCRPCTPYKTGMEANKTLETFDPLLRPPVTEGLSLCNASSVWEEGWESIYDSTVGPDMAEMRKKVVSATQEQCIEYFYQLKKRTWNWDAPAPEIICQRREVGPAALVGQKGQSFFTFLDLLSERSKTKGPAVSVTMLADPLFHFTFNESTVYAPARPKDSSWLTTLAAKLEARGMTAQQTIFTPADAPTTETPSDIYVLMLGGHDLADVVNKWAIQGAAPRACQLLLALHSKHEAKGKVFRVDVTRVLRDLNFQMSSCIQEPEDDVERCTYFSLKHCA